MIGLGQRRRVVVRGPSRSFGTQITGRFASAALSFVAVAVTSRYLGAADYGALTAALAVAGLVTAFSDFGVNAVVTRRVARGEGTLPGLLEASGGLALSVVTGLLVVAALVWVTVPEGARGAILPVVVLAPYLAFSVLASCLTPVFQVHDRFGGIAVAEVVSAAATLLGALLVAGSQSTLYGFLVVTDVAALLRLLTIGGFAYRLHRVVVRPRLTLIGGLLREAVPIGLTSFVGVAYYRTDTLVLAWRGSLAETGFYGLAYRVILAFLVLPALMASSAYFGFADASPAQLPQRLSRAYRSLFDLLVPVCAGGVVLAPYLVRFVGGEAYAGAAGALRLLSLVLLLFGFNNLLGTLLTAQGRSRTVLVLTSGALAAQLVVVFLTAPAWGATGAAAGYLAGEVLSTIAICAVAARSFPGLLPGVLGAFRVPLLGGTALAIVALALAPVGWVLAGVAGVAAYGLVWWLGRRTLRSAADAE